MRMMLSLVLVSVAVAQASPPAQERDPGWTCTTLQTRQVFAADQIDDPLAREVIALLDPVARDAGQGGPLLVSGALPERTSRFAIEVERQACRDGTDTPTAADFALKSVRITACAETAGDDPEPARHLRRWLHDDADGWRLVERRDWLEPDCRID